MKRKVTAVLAIFAIAILASAATGGKTSKRSNASTTTSTSSSSSSSSSGFGGIDVDVGLPTTEPTSVEYRLWACGGNQYGSLGRSDIGTMTAVVVSVTEEKPIAVATGMFHSLALYEDGRVEAWGDNTFGQLGYKNDLPCSYDRLVVRDLPPIRMIAAGWFHSLAVDIDGRVWAWGNNSTGQLGRGTLGPLDGHERVCLGIPGKVVSIAGGMGHTLALTEDHRLFAWGNNFTDQLGSHDYMDLLTFIKSQVGRLPSELPLTPEELWAWLVTYLTQLGRDAARLVALSPVEIGTFDASRVAAGALHSMILMNDHRVKCWGANFIGQLGDVTDLVTPDPVQVRIVVGLGTQELTDAKAIAAGAVHSAAIREDGSVYAWGYNGEGQLGIGFYEQTVIKASPYGLKVKYLADARLVASSYGHTLVSLGDGSVWSWGLDSYGQMGNGIYQPFYPEPVQMRNISLAQNLAAGGVHSLVTAQK